MDLVPSLMTTHIVANPEYDPAEARRQVEEKGLGLPNDEDTVTSPSPSPPSDLLATSKPTTQRTMFQTTQKVLADASVGPNAMPGITTTLSSVDKEITLDIRWTVLCDLFLILIADSVYDARSRVLLENVAWKLGLGWLDVVKFESRVTEALEIQEGVEKMECQKILDGQQKAAQKKRYVMMGLATLGMLIYRMIFVVFDINYIQVEVWLSVFLLGFSHPL